MNIRKTSLVVLTALGFIGLTAFSQTTPSVQAPPPDKITVPLSDPSKPAVIKADIMFGTVKVVGYEGKDVLVTATPREKSLRESTGFKIVAPAIAITREALAGALADIQGRVGVRPDKEKAEQEKKAKTAGMKQIPLDSSGLTVEEDNNRVEISLESWKRAYDIEIRAPFGSSLKLDGANLDEIRVENLSGEIELESANGDIKLLNVAGPVTANTTNGDIEAVLNRAAADKPMSFVTFNGDVDVTLPADAKASFRIKSTMGELYTDFDLVLKSLLAEPEKTTAKEGAKFRVSLERAVYGTINGGGPEIKFQNYRGNIYIRKKK